MNPLRIYFDLDGQEFWHRREWENSIAAMGPSPHGTIVDTATDADCIIRTLSPFHFGRGGSVFGAKKDAFEQPTIEWNFTDQPTGRLPGFYCSLPRLLFDSRRHRTFCYPLCYNECVDFCDFSKADKLFGFMGNITSGLRHRLFAVLHKAPGQDRMLVEIQGGPWDRMFDRSGISEKTRYIKSLERCRFFLCPRGNGVGTVRLFEAMKAARVPVIISDAYVLPSGIDWENCSLRIRERDIGRIPEILASREDDWQRLASNARHEWEKHFSNAALLGSISQGAREILDSVHFPKTPLSYYLRALLYLQTSNLKSNLGRLRGMLAR